MAPLLLAVAVGAGAAGLPRTAEAGVVRVVLSMLLLRARLPLRASDRLLVRGDCRPPLGALSSCVACKLLVDRVKGVTSEGKRLT
jgi:hypothetical protein